MLPPIEDALAQLETSEPTQPTQSALPNLPPIEQAVSMLDASPIQTETPQITPQLPPIEKALETIDTQPVQTAPITSDIKYPVTQGFGPSQYDYLSGGFNYGVDFATPEGTDINLPQGNWVVEEINNDGGFNQGYGNTLVVKNATTGEKLRFEHLQDVNPALQVGAISQGGLVARSGNSGNSTGPHTSIPYWDAQGNPADVLQSPYANIIPH